MNWSKEQLYLSIGKKQQNLRFHASVFQEDLKVPLGKVWIVRKNRFQMRDSSWIWYNEVEMKIII